ncbi:hypothetical protein FSP39_005592 [Pinctada imbricata]|uniref:G-protein coupled receptors family 1 profile domain-containing protein n=1 Tax=Pinctada imbricata TaxID=66713 RepID=A0AA88Y998_PINIB|nr:hypothetical protein FSP39_005592 [Pinctada imbricata]
MQNSTAFANLSNITLHPHDAPKTPTEYLQRFAPLALTIDRVISPIWYVIGLIGNPIAVRIWLCRRMRKNNSSAVYVGSLAIVHTLFLLLHITMELQGAWGISTYDEPVLCETFSIIMIMSQYYAPLLVLAFTVERYIAVNHPFLKERFCTVRRAIYVTAALGVFSFALSTVQAYIWSYDAESGKCVHVLYEDRREFENVWTLTTEILIFFVVPICVLIFNILVIIEIRKLTSSGPVVTLQNQGSGSSNPTSTVTLLSVSFYLICTLLPASVVYTLQALLPKGNEALSMTEMDTNPTWQNYFTYLTIRKIVEEICLSNYACYFFIYYITGQYFRKEVKKLFGCSRKCFHNKKRKDSTTSPGKRSEYTLVSSNGKTACDYHSTQM